MSSPLVSIIIPVYNGSNYVKEAIDSALAQTYPNTEIIVVNDGSRDDGATESIVTSYGDKIRYIKKENGGVSSALNAGIQAMRGEYFTWLSHDDIYMPCKVQSQMDVISTVDSANTIVMCANRHIDKDSNPMGNPRFSNLPVKKEISWQQALMHVIKYSCNGCTLLIPKSAFVQCGGFDEGLRYSQDYLMWALIFSKGYSLVYHDYVGVGSRVHDKQLTQTGRELFVHDSGVVADILSPILTKLSDGTNDYIYEFAKTNATHNNKHVVKHCIQDARTAGKLSFRKRFALKLYCMYGSVRPTIRRLYYRYVKKVKTQ